MIRLEEVYKIGKFNRPHGVKGELQFTFTDDVFDRMEADFLICMIDGILVPFYLEEYRFRSDTTALVKLEDVDNQEKAARFTNVEVYFLKKIAERSPSEELTWDYFVGFTIEDISHGVLGVVADVDQTTLNTLFIVEKEGKELLIPACEEFITEINSDRQIIRVDLPEGMLTMNE